MTIGHHFEYDILVAVAECRAEGVGGVGGGGSVEHHGSLGRVEEFGHLLPLTVRRDVDRLRLAAAGLLQHQRKLGPVVHVEVIMPREVGVQNEFFNLVVFCIEQNIHPEREVVVKIV